MDSPWRTMSEDPPKVKAAHDVVDSLRAEGYTVVLHTSDVVDDFEHGVERSKELLEADDLAACFVVAHREGQTDYGTTVVVNDSTIWGLIQIEMLGAHFRTVHDALPLDVDELVDAMIDEAVSTEEVGDV